MIVICTFCSVIILHTCPHLYGIFRRKDATKLLELYMAQAESGRLAGPTPVWIALMLFPMVSWWLLVTLVQFFSGKGWLILVGVCTICYFIYTQVPYAHDMLFEKKGG